MEVNDSLSDVITIRGSGPRSQSAHLGVDKGLPEVIVGRGCGQAVLRGAEVYAPGVVGMPSYVKAGDRVRRKFCWKSGALLGVNFIFRPFDLVRYHATQTQSLNITGVGVR